MLTAAFVNVDKPAGMTAHDVVARMRRILRIKQIGHAGTLDPMATGVLPIAVGKATRLLRFLDGRKVYRADILLGTRTTTDDIEGEVLPPLESQLDTATPEMPAPNTVHEQLMSFVGIQQQVPPLYSAVHLDGRRLYEMARAGEAPPEIPARQVEVYSIEILENQPPRVVARISCAAGTYIRSIARDLGERLGLGGCLQGLVREAAGPFALQQAKALDELEKLATEQRFDLFMEEPAPLLNLPAMVLEQPEARAICLGQVLKLNETQTAQLESFNRDDQESAYVMLCFEQQLIAVGQAVSSNGILTVKPEVVLRDGKDIS